MHRVARPLYIDGRFRRVVLRFSWSSHAVSGGLTPGGVRSALTTDAPGSYFEISSSLQFSPRLLPPFVSSTFLPCGFFFCSFGRKRNGRKVKIIINKRKLRGEKVPERFCLQGYQRTTRHRGLRVVGANGGVNIVCSRHRA